MVTAMAEPGSRPLDLGLYGTVLIDLDGTAYIDGEALPGVAAFMQRVRQDGQRVGFLTNMSFRSREWCLDVLHRADVEVSPDELLTSIDVMAEVLLDRGVQSVAAIGSNEFKAQLRSSGITVGDLAAGPVDSPDALAVGMWPGVSEASIAAASQLASKSVPVFATSGVGSLPTATGMVSGAAETVRRLRSMSDMPVTITGKPGQPFTDVVKRRFQLVEPVLMIGDTMEVDIVMADTNGWDSLLVLTGASGDPRCESGAANGGPTYVVKTLEDIDC